MQEIIVGLIVCGAAAYLVRSTIKSSRGGGCGCSNKGCKKNAPKAADTLIQISFDKRQ